VNMLKDRLMGEEERDQLSQRLGNGIGTRAKRRREIEEMQEDAMKPKSEKQRTSWGEG
jgi:hypothetical protein